MYYSFVVICIKDCVSRDFVQWSANNLKTFLAERIVVIRTYYSCLQNIVFNYQEYFPSNNLQICKEIACEINKAI